MNKVFSRASLGGEGTIYAKSIRALHAGYGRFDMTGGVSAKQQKAQSSGGLSAPAKYHI